MIFFKKLGFFQLLVPRLCSFPSTLWAASSRLLLFQRLSLSIILTLSHKYRWLPFSFHILSAIADRREKQWRDYLNNIFIFLERPDRLAVKVLKWFSRLNHFYAQINRGHLRKVKEYSGRNVVLQPTAITTRTAVRKITHKIVRIKPHLKNSDRWLCVCFFLFIFTASMILSLTSIYFVLNCFANLLLSFQTEYFLFFFSGSFAICSIQSAVESKYFYNPIVVVLYVNSCWINTLQAFSLLV